MNLTGRLKQEAGFTLVELMISLTVFAIIMGVATATFLSQMEHNTREYSIAEAEIETNIALNNLLKTDISLAGYGLANNYPDYDADGTADWTPSAITAIDNPGAGGDSLLLTGTALGVNSRATRSWSYYDTDQFVTWTDPRENISPQDLMILLEPNSKTLLDVGPGKWLFRFDGNNLSPVALFGGDAFGGVPDGTLAYGINRADIKDDDDVSVAADLLPFYVVRYYLGGDSPGVCAPGTQSLLRAEAIKAADADEANEPNGGDPLLSCVLNLQIGFGLDSNDDGTLDLWDNGGGNLAGYSFEDQRKRVKQVRVYLLAQNGRRDADYQYPDASVWVGDGSLPIGERIDLTDEQRRYRWRVLSVNVWPKNIRW